MSRTKKLLSAALAATAVLSAGVAAGTPVSPLADAEAAIAISGTVTEQPPGVPRRQRAAVPLAP